MPWSEACGASAESVVVVFADVPLKRGSAPGVLVVDHP